MVGEHWQVVNRPRQDPATLCSAGSMLLLLLASTALALLLVLGRLDAGDGFWQALGLAGLFIFLVVLAVAAIYCHFGYSPDTARGGWLLFGLIQLMVLACSLAVIVAADWLRPLQLHAHTDPGFFVLRNLGISVVVGAMAVRYLALQARWKRQVEAEAEARMRSLQARIHPHFLFNALNTISSLIQEKPAQAEQATLDLSDLLRSGLSEQTHHSLQDELDLIRGYLRIEQLRLGDRLTVDWHLAEDLPLDQQLPALLIQPLVENAIIHGIARLPSGGTLRIAGEVHRRQRMRFVIENPVPAEGESDEKPGNRMALDNVAQRLALAWDEGARLKTQQEQGRFRAELVLPISS
jgi:two-component system, LytTR family, sensor histidine kinase AlgZ